MKRNSKIDSSCQETTPSDHVPTHPAVLAVFRTDNILEEICSYLDFNDLKQFRLVSPTCSSEGRRSLIKLDQHWVVVKSKDDGWQLQLDNVLGKLEEETSSRGENCNKKLLGWIFKRLELNYWEHAMGHSDFLQHWGHYLRKIHLKEDQSDSLTISNGISIIHHLLTVCCPNLEEVEVELANFKYKSWSSLFINVLDILDFPTPLLNLKYLRVWNITSLSAEEGEVLQRFCTRLVRAAGTALETLEIGYDSEEMEERMLKSQWLNVGVSNFQTLQEITLDSAGNVANFSHTVHTCFPELSKLILRWFTSTHIVAIRPESFPALKSLTIHYTSYINITNETILLFLQHFPNLEVLTMSSGRRRRIGDGLPVIPNPNAPVSKSLRSFTFETEDYDLDLLRCAVNMFPNLVTLNLLGFGLGRRNMYRKCEPEYTFGELIDTISPFNRLQHLYVNHAFHTSPQLVDAIQLMSNLTALQTIVLSQAAHKRDFYVGLYLTTSDPEFQFILNCDGVKILKSVQLLGFRFGTTQKEVVEEAAAKGGHVSFGTICPCCIKPWICEDENRVKPCPGWKPVYHA